MQGWLKRQHHPLPLLQTHPNADQRQGHRLDFILNLSLNAVVIIFLWGCSTAVPRVQECRGNTW